MAEAKTEAPTSDANLGWCDIQIGLCKKIEVQFLPRLEGFKSIPGFLVKQIITIKKIKFVDVPICLVSKDQPLF